MANVLKIVGGLIGSLTLLAFLVVAVELLDRLTRGTFMQTVLNIVVFAPVGILLVVLLYRLIRRFVK